MTRSLVRFGFLVLLAAGAVSTVMLAQRPAFVPVTAEMLVKPNPDDWLMYSRTYDAQRFSPLRQITRQNVGQLKEVVQEGAGNRRHRRHPDRLPRRACI